MPSNLVIWSRPALSLNARLYVSFVSHEDEVVVPSYAQVDRALLHLLPKWSDRFPHMLGLRKYVEDEFDRSVELSSDDNLEIVREFDDCRPAPIRCHCCSPCCCSSFK